MSALLSEVETFAKITFKHVVPYKAVNALKRNIRKLDRKWRSSAGKKTEVHDIAQLKRDLERSGLDPDRDIFIHASFSKIGTDLKAEAVIDMILDFIGPDTTVLMPAYAMPDNMLGWMADPAPFDLTRSPSMMGSSLSQPSPLLIREDTLGPWFLAWGRARGRTSLDDFTLPKDRSDHLMPAPFNRFGAGHCPLNTVPSRSYSLQRAALRGLGGAHPQGAFQRQHAPFGTQCPSAVTCTSERC